MTLVEIKDLSIEFRTRRGTVDAVNGVSLEISKGEFVGLVGESGSGKSVLAQSLLGIIEDPGAITAGDIRLHGDSILNMTESELQEIRGNTVSIIFQDPMNSLNPTLSVGEQIAEAIRIHQDVGESISLSTELKRKLFGTVKNAESWRRAVEMLESVQIPQAESRAPQFPHEFSGGMRQRAMIAVALSCNPDLLIADEPTTALDVTTEAQILEELNRLTDTFDTSILLITHDLAVIAETCDWVNVMYAGELIEKAPAPVLFHDPQHPYTEALIKTIPNLHETEELVPIPGNVPDLIDIPFACHFAPRCPEAEEECLRVDPQLQTVATDHEVACLRRNPKEVTE